MASGYVKMALPELVGVSGEAMNLWQGIQKCQ